MFFAVGELKDFTVTLSPTYVAGGSTSVPTIQCAKQTSAVIPGEIKETICPNGSFSRHVVIKKKTVNNDPLALCEVEVFGTASELFLFLK